MLSAIYNALWFPALPFALVAAAGADRRAFRERLGHGVSSPSGDSLTIWLHAASVGEIEAVHQVALELLDSATNARLVVTTMTASGREAAQRRIPNASAYALAPLDFPKAVRAFVQSVRPEVALITETELWPNYFIEAKKAGARVAIINGRISERSFRRYRLARPVFANALGLIDVILAQSSEDANRYAALGAAPEKVIVAGNLKFDLARGTVAPSLRPGLERFLAAHPAILIAGSTGPGEEDAVLEAFEMLSRQFAPMALILAPRHLERVGEVETAIKRSSRSYIRASALPDDGPGSVAENDADILLLDTMGELRALYTRATIAFVGGSLTPGRGGQNLAEPAAAGIPVLFGPFHDNQRHIARPLLETGGGRVVADASEFAQACAAMLSDDAARRAAGDAAKGVVRRLEGGTAVTLAHLRALANRRDDDAPL